MFIVQRINKRCDHEGVECYCSIACYKHVTSSRSRLFLCFICGYQSNPRHPCSDFYSRRMQFTLRPLRQGPKFREYRTITIKEYQNDKSHCMQRLSSDLILKSTSQRLSPANKTLYFLTSSALYK